MPKIVVVVMHPMPRVWDALCERTCELAPFLEHIERAELKSRQTSDDGVTRCVHAWRARANVPALLAHHVDKGVLEWTGRTEWRAEVPESRWVVEPKSMKGAALCEALMRFSAAAGGRGTRVDLELALVGPQRMAGMQMLTNTLLATHFRKLVDAAAKLIEKR
ncbi:MAG: hypothetical protein H7125_10035 [Proteobacteria bacterium]|nr:hypothetical protein [Burkholderiales bacterium]